MAVIAAIPFDKEDGISTTLNTDNIIISTPVDNSLTTIDTIESLRSGLDGFGLLGQVINYGIDAANYVYTNLSQTTLQDLAEAPVEPSVVSENSAGGGFSFLLNAVLIPYLTVLLPIPAPAEKLPPPTLPTTTR